ncbi:hypothetical protein HY041_00260 [Candidatus Roizmanbacteria bacterium]|nr:hypothetical protein [Candidatus Roizmanbacteria bacterium]
MKIKKPQLVFIGVLIAVFLLMGGLMLRGTGVSKKESQSPQPTETVIPTVDSSVKIDLTSSLGGKEVVLEIKNIPSSTQTIDYELSYQTKQQGLQGVIGTITLNSESGYEKRITLGTCSSGKCVYHDVVGKIKVTLKFTGNYGDKIFEKEYEL